MEKIRNKIQLRLCRAICVVVLMLVLALALGLAFGGCCSKERQNPERELLLRLSFDPGLFKDTVQRVLPGARTVSPNRETTRVEDIILRATAGYRMRFIIDLYPARSADPQPSERIRRVVYYTGGIAAAEHVGLRVPMGEPLRAAVWVDFVREGSMADLYYNTSNLGAVTMNRGLGGGRHKLAFEGCATIHPDALAEGAVCDLPLEMPLGFYRIADAGLQYFLSQGIPLPAEMTVSARYDMWVPTGYNVFTRRINKFSENVRFTEEVPGNSAAILSDVVFVDRDAPALPVDGHQSIISLSFEINNAALSRVIIGSGQHISVPLRRNWYTEISGEFMNEGSPGGIETNTNFGGEIEVPF